MLRIYGYDNVPFNYTVNVTVVTEPPSTT